jgi:hypothetical protein
MTQKLFIVSRDHPEVLASLTRAIAGEPGVEIFYDRRLPGKAASREQVERRLRPDVDAQLRERGFAVVHLTPASTRSASTRPSRTARFRF